MAGVGKGGGQPGGQAVGGHHVEADAGDQGDAGLPCLVAAALHRLEDADLACDVEIVHPGRQAGGDHRPAGEDERPGTVENRRHSRQAGGEPRRLVEAEDAAFQPELIGQFTHGIGVAAGKDGAQPAARGRSRHQLAGVAVGAVDQERRVGHDR